MERRYKVGEFAELTGTSVRTLHHYDHIGLLKPQGHSEGGHRLYSEIQFVRLQQIMTLKSFGFSLEDTAELLDSPDFDLAASVRAQRRVMRQRMDWLRHIDEAFDDLLSHFDETNSWDWSRALSIVRRLNETDTHITEKATMEKLYTEEQMKQFDEIRQQVPAEEIKAVEEGWAELIAELRENMDLDPKSPEARALAGRWNRLTEDTVKGFQSNPELLDAIGENYRAGNFEEFPNAPDAAMFEFIQKVNEAASE